MMAYLMAGLTEIPAILREDISDVVLKEMELEENLRRKDFHWTETTRAMQQLQSLKEAHEGVATGGRYKEKGNNPGWSLEKTAELLGCSVMTVSNDINLARSIQEHPDLAAKVVHLPKDMARKKLRNLIHEQYLQKAVSEKKIDLSAELLLGDCTDLIKSLKDESVDLVVTDPPYADETMSAVGQHLTLQYAENSTNMGDREKMRALYIKLFSELQRVMKKGAHLYIFHAMSWYTNLHSLLRSSGFEPDDQPLIWSKGIGTALPKDYHYIPSYEPITFAMKLPKIRSLSKPVPNVLQIPPLRPENRVHPLQKPEDLLSIFINNSSLVGQTVLDPFAGSGSTLLAAKRLQRKAIGFELDNGNFLRAQELLGKEQA